MKKRSVPTHHITDYAEQGVKLRRLTVDSTMSNSTYLHRDDYYIFVLLQSGVMVLNVDFGRYAISAHHIGCVLPGQVHQFVSGSDTEGWLMFIDSTLLSEEHLRMMSRYAFSMNPMPIDGEREQELSSLFPMLQKRLDATSAGQFARAIVDVFTEVISQHDETAKLNPRHRETLLRFNGLLNQHIARNRQPSFYASELCITTGYLNEILTATVGLSTSKYIQREIVLRMKRELAYSKRSIQEISLALGFEDYAYFSRFFSKASGISPAAFRAKYRE